MHINTFALISAHLLSLKWIEEEKHRRYVCTEDGTLWYYGARTYGEIEECIWLNLKYVVKYMNDLITKNLLRWQEPHNTTKQKFRSYHATPCHLEKSSVCRWR